MVVSARHLANPFSNQMSSREIHGVAPDFPEFSCGDEVIIHNGIPVGRNQQLMPENTGIGSSQVKIAVAAEVDGRGLIGLCLKQDGNLVSLRQDIGFTIQ